MSAVDLYEMVGVARVVGTTGTLIAASGQQWVLAAEHDRRVAELLEANNRYQQDARAARRVLAASLVRDGFTLIGVAALATAVAFAAGVFLALETSRAVDGAPLQLECVRVGGIIVGCREVR